MWCCMGFLRAHGHARARRPLPARPNLGGAFVVGGQLLARARVCCARSRRTHTHSNTPTAARRARRLCCRLRALNYGRAPPPACRPASRCIRNVQKTKANPRAFSFFRTGGGGARDTSHHHHHRCHCHSPLLSRTHPPPNTHHHSRHPLAGAARPPPQGGDRALPRRKPQDHRAVRRPQARPGRRERGVCFGFACFGWLIVVVEEGVADSARLTHDSCLKTHNTTTTPKKHQR